MGLLDRLGIRRLSEGLAKTREGIVQRVGRLVSVRPSLDAQFLEGLEEILVGADVGVATTAVLLAGLKERLKEEGSGSTAHVLKILKDEVNAQFAEVEHRSAGAVQGGGNGFPKPRVIMVVGVNGVGKTTSIGKLAHRQKQEGHSVLIAAADTFRAAANEQLAIWAHKAGAELIQQAAGADPASVAFDAVSSAIARGVDRVIIDTAGRLHTKTNLMEELKKIRRVVGKVLPGAPHEVLLVIDASTGQNGIQQARQFDASVGVTGLVLTKLDGTARGGVVLAIARDLALPVTYIGVGEGIDDLQPFDSGAFVDALFGE